MKICIISERFYPQIVGSGTGAYLLAKGLSANGHQVTVLTDWIIEKLPGALKLPFDMRYIQSFEDYVMGVASFQVPAQQIYRVLKENEFDIIHVHNLMPLLITSFMESYIKCPKVFTFYNTPNGSNRAIGYFEEPELDIALARSIVANSKYSRVIAASMAYYDFALRIGIPQKLTTLSYLGVEQNNFANPGSKNENNILRKYFEDRLDGNELVIMLPGRIVERKGILEAIRAVAEVKKHFAVKLILTGLTLPFSEQFGDRVKNEILQSGIQNEVVIPKSIITRDDLPSVYERATIVITPSYYEGLGLTAIEALQAGRPLIATSVKGLDEVTENNVNSLTVPPRDSHALAVAILKLAKDPELAARLASAGQKSAAKFDIRNHVNTVLKIYEQVLNQ